MYYLFNMFSIFCRVAER
uniref:Uncharacterized protein n=1 Tax=Rhizophora mucronata TaxID=61149 RepID=A0A2P2NVV9_RHIMU